MRIQRGRHGRPRAPPGRVPVYLNRVKKRATSPSDLKFIAAAARHVTYTGDMGNNGFIVHRNNIAIKAKLQH
jgi:hypothetical protein